MLEARPFDFGNRRQREQEEVEKRAAALAFFGPSYQKRDNMRGNGQNRPICPRCQKPFGNRHIHWTSKRFAIGETIPPYTGNLHVVGEELSVGAGMGPDNGPGATLTRETWDGISYRSPSGSDPFCTNRCGLAFGRLAFEAGYRLRKG